MLPFKIDLTGKTVVITGGGGVLCSEFAYNLAECGANIALLDIRPDNAQIVADKIIGAGGKAIAVATDVLNKESLVNARNIIKEKFGLGDILINGAGGNSPKCTTTKEYLFSEDLENHNSEIITFFDLLPENIKFVFDLNFTGAMLTTQVFAKDMANRKDCAILNISSMNAFTPLTKIPAYSAAKAAVSNFTQWLAVHFSKVGIRVNAMAPGFFVTDQNRNMLFNADGTPTERTGKILAATPMGRFGEPKELIGALLWLCCPEASGFVNGVVVPVDGGFNAYSGV
ncbi:MAG: SDR family oxidoreductase [Oscillospiraceae bacterium]|nr:SDR family oxidoreductase [Oscillospiraceae bacterium]